MSKKFKCTKCGYKYEGRVDKPKACPECKQRGCVIRQDAVRTRSPKTR